MGKRSSRSAYQKKHIARQSPTAAASRSVGTRTKLSWQRHQGDLVLSFTPRLLNQEIAEREIHRSPLRMPLTFSFHRIAQAEPFAVGSVQSFARQIVERWPDARRARVFGTRWLKEGIQENRCRLIEEALRELMSLDAHRSLEIQVFLTRNDHAFVGPSLLNDARPESIGLQSSHLGGRVGVKETKDPPSRAYLKLIEGLFLMGWKIEASHRVLDLAAAPGGWTWVALQANARVVAVDRSKLAPSIMRSSRMQFVKGDVFQFQSRDRFDWVFCDVICEPERSLALLEKVVREMPPGRIIWTLKFKGEIRFEDLNTADRMLQNRSYLIRHLNSNKNEVTIFLDLRGDK